jgi:hypothetical protein
MTFLYPAFLWALAALSIPVVIHLFNFRKTTRVYFSNTRFLKHIQEATTAKRKLKHYLILAARLLFLAFLVFAFCQPIIPAEEQFRDTRNIVLYLDNSQSMSAQMEDRVRGLDAAVGFAHNIVDVFPADTRYKLLTNDFSPFSNTFKTKTEVLDLLTQVRLSPVSRTLQEVRDRIQQSVSPRGQEVFWISDLQKSTLGPAVVDSVMRWHIVPIQYNEESNVFVDSAYLDNPFSTGGGKNVMHVRIRNDGQKDVNQLNLKLTLKAIQAATTTISVPRGGTAEATFDLAGSLSGLNEARISFNDFPVTFDNEFFLALNFTNKINVIEVKNATERTSVERVFGNTEIFNFRTYNTGNFNYSLLSDADLVVVNGLNSIDLSLSGALRNYLNENGTLLLIPGTSPDIVNLSGVLRIPRLSIRSEHAITELDRPDFSNPFFENIFEEKSVSMAMPRASKVLDWGADRNAILSFRNDQPFLSRFSQFGALYLVSCALDQSLTDFFNHALFVPVMYRIAASGQKNTYRPYYTPQDNLIRLHVDSLQGETPLRWVGSEEIIPPQRKLNDDVVFDIPKYSIGKGFYKVVMVRDTVNLLAFNLDKAESLMDQYRGDELKTLLGGADNITIFEVGSSEAFSNEIKKRYLGTPLWKYALIASILFLMTEILLIRFLK